jgi:hypothetical protein
MHQKHFPEAFRQSKYLKMTCWVNFNRIYPTSALRDYLKGQRESVLNELACWTQIGLTQGKPGQVSKVKQLKIPFEYE